MGPDCSDAGRHSVTLRGRVLFGADKLVAQWVQARVDGMYCPPGTVGLGVVHEGDLVAGVTYTNFNGVHMEVCIAAETGKPWAGRQTLKHLFGYPFLQMQCEAISVLVPGTNLESLNLATKLGFEPEAIVKFAARDGSPLIILKMYRDTCRWLR